MQSCRPSRRAMRIPAAVWQRMEWLRLSGTDSTAPQCVRGRLRSAPRWFTVLHPLIAGLSLTVCCRCAPPDLSMSLCAATSDSRERSRAEQSGSDRIVLSVPTGSSRDYWAHADTHHHSLRTTLSATGDAVDHAPARTNADAAAAVSAAAVPALCALPLGAAAVAPSQ